MKIGNHEPTIAVGQTLHDFFFAFSVWTTQYSFLIKLINFSYKFFANLVNGSLYNNGRN